MDTLVDRLQNREPLADSLLRFADELGDPGSDLVVAALVLNIQAQGRQLRAVLSALARSSRSELEARRRIEAERRAVRRGVQVVVLVTVVVAPVAVEQRVQADLQVSRQVPGDYLLRQR